MADHDGDSGSRGLTRRELIKRAAVVGGAAVWAAPVIRMAVGGGGDPGTVGVDGARLATFGSRCNPSLLDLLTVRTVCATSLANARTVFTSTVTTECGEECSERGPCHRSKSCKPNTRNGATVVIIGCTGPGPACPVPPYATVPRQWVCRAVVVCNCVCR